MEKREEKKEARRNGIIPPDLSQIYSIGSSSTLAGIVDCLPQLPRKAEGPIYNTRD